MEVDNLSPSNQGSMLLSFKILATPSFLGEYLAKQCAISRMQDVDLLVLKYVKLIKVIRESEEVAIVIVNLRDYMWELLVKCYNNVSNLLFHLLVLRYMKLKSLERAEKWPNVRVNLKYCMWELLVKCYNNVSHSLFHLLVLRYVKLKSLERADKWPSVRVNLRNYMWKPLVKCYNNVSYLYFSIKINKKWN